MHLFLHLLALILLTLACQITLPSRVILYMYTYLLPWCEVVENNDTARSCIAQLFSVNGGKQKAWLCAKVTKSACQHISPASWLINNGFDLYQMNLWFYIIFYTESRVKKIKSYTHTSWRRWHEDVIFANAIYLWRIFVLTIPSVSGVCGQYVYFCQQHLSTSWKCITMYRIMLKIFINESNINISWHN